MADPKPEPKADPVNPPAGGNEPGNPPKGEPAPAPPQKQEPARLSDEQIKSLQGTIYSKFQSDLDSARGRETKATEKLKVAEEKLSKFDNIEDLEARATKADAIILQSEATNLRSALIEKEFPQLGGKEKFIPLGTPDEMRQHAEDMTKEFGLEAKPGETQVKGQINTPPQGSANLDALAAMTEDELKQTLKNVPTEELQKLLGRKDGTWDSDYTKGLRDKKE